jgi:hypothetical protein
MRTARLVLTPVALEEHHDLFNLLLFFPGLGNRLHAARANAGHFAQAVRRRFDHIEDIQPK